MQQNDGRHTIRLHELPEIDVIDRRLQVEEHEVHVWEIDLDTELEPSCLDQAEQQRAQRFRFERDRRRWVTAHTALRRILSRYVGIGPDRLRFATADHGKPYLAPEFDGGGIRFNLSHSGAVALVAVARNEVGIDIEDASRAVDWLALSPEVFSAREAQGLLGDQRKPALTPWALWTLKEAYLKGRGCGLTIPLRSFEIMPDPYDPTFRIAIEADRSDGLDWHLLSLPIRPGYAAALAATGPLDRLQRGSIGPPPTTHNRAEPLPSGEMAERQTAAGTIARWRRACHSCAGGAVHGASTTDAGNTLQFLLQRIAPPPYRSGWQALRRVSGITLRNEGL
jgi:4'-phosphopantetheinyl transferase